MKKVTGVLVEPRKLEAVYKLIENFRDVLGETDLIFYCGKSNYNHFMEYYKDDNFIKIKSLLVDNLTAKEHNNLWKDINFWNDFVDYEYILTVQTDGCLCKNSIFKLNDFFEYDYIGGYSEYKWWWKETQGLHDYNDYQCFNGGFSLRRVSSMLEVLNNYVPLPTEDYRPDLSFRSYGEDLYFVVGLLILNKYGEGSYKVGLDSFAVNFCTHTHYIKRTFCVHKLDNYVTKDVLEEFLKYCPEFINFTGDKLIKKIN